MALSAGQIQSMRSTVSAVLGDSATNSRTWATTSCWLYPDGGTVDLAGDGRIAPLPRFSVILPDGTDCRRADILTVAGRGTYYVTELVRPETYSSSTMAVAVQLQDARGDLTFFATATVDVWRAGSQVLTVLVHIEPIDPKPFELMQAPDDSQGQTIFDHYVLYTLDATLPDIRARDEIVDGSETDPLTGSAARYYVRRVKRWVGSHLEIEADRVATTPTG